MSSMKVFIKKLKLRRNFAAFNLWYWFTRFLSRSLKSAYFIPIYRDRQETSYLLWMEKARLLSIESQKNELNAIIA